MKELFN